MPFIEIFKLFLLNTTLRTIFTTKIREKCYVQPVFSTQDSNPQPSEHESPPITPRPGIPPKLQQT